MDEGPYKGTYDNINDLQQDVVQEEKALKDYTLNLFKSLGVDSDLYTDEWYDSLPPKKKEIYRDAMKRSDTRKGLEALVSEPQNKAKILDVLRQYFTMYQNMDDDAAWRDLSLENKINYLRFALNKGKK